MAVDEVALAEQRALLREILRLANSDLVALWRLAETQGPEVVFEWLREGVPEIVEAYRAAAVDLGAAFYEDAQGLLAAPEAAVRAAAVDRSQLESSLRWAVFNEGNAAVLSLVAGIVQKHVVDGFRDYGMAAADGVGGVWVRAAHPGACNFCRMLATRGLDGYGGYSSAESAGVAGKSAGGVRKRGKGRKNQAAGDAFHNNCMCVPVLASEYEPPEYVYEWQELYYEARAAAGPNTSPYRILSKMREISGHNH